MNTGTTMAETVTVDDLFKLLGNPGKYQLLTFILLCFNYFHVVSNFLVMAVYGSKVPFRCNVTEAPFGWTNATNISDQSQYTCSVPHIPWINETTNGTEPCATGWIYDTEEANMITEWDLVCENRYLIALASSMFYAGLMIGSLIFGFLGDRMGRKPVILTTLYAQLAIGVGLHFVPSFIPFILLRFLQGIFIQGLHGSTFTMVMETFHPDFHSLAGGVLELFWSGTFMALAGIWYLIQDWRYIQLAISLPSALTITYIWLLPESLRWLLARRKFDEAEGLMQKIVDFNDLPYPKTAFADVKTRFSSQQLTDGRRYNVLDLLKTPVLRRRSLILFFMWFTLNFVYFGHSLGITDFAGNKFLNFSISGAAEFPAYFCGIFLFKRIGRRVSSCLAFVLAGLAFIGSGFAYSNEPGRQNLALALSVFGKCFTAFLYITYIFTTELYPTEVRNIGFGACTVFLSAGAAVASQVLGLGTMGFEQLPIMIFGGFAIVAGALTLLLPETLGETLPDSIEDVENHQSARAGK